MEDSNVSSSSKPITREAFSKFLKANVPDQAKPHVGGHCIRISATCHLFRNKLATPEHIMELGRWQSRASFNRYVDQQINTLIRHRLL